MMKNCLLTIHCIYKADQKVRNKPDTHTGEKQCWFLSVSLSFLQHKICTAHWRALLGTLWSKMYFNIHKKKVLMSPSKSTTPRIQPEAIPKAGEACMLVPAHTHETKNIWNPLISNKEKNRDGEKPKHTWENWKPRESVGTHLHTISPCHQSS